MSSGSVLPEFEPGSFGSQGPSKTTFGSGRGPSGLPVLNETTVIASAGDTSASVDEPTWFVSLPATKKQSMRATIDGWGSGEDPSEASIQKMCDEYALEPSQVQELRDFLKASSVPLESLSPRLSAAGSNPSTPSIHEQPSSIKSRTFSQVTGAGVVDSYESHEQVQARIAEEKLKRLQATYLHPTYLTFMHNDKIVVEMEDHYYREDASRFHSALSALFTYGFQGFVICMTISDCYKISTSDENDIENVGEHYGYPDLDTAERKAEVYRQNFRIGSIILRFVIMQPLVFFGCTFFKSDNYYTKPDHLLGAFFYFSIWFHGYSLLWINNNYGLHVLFLIVIFYMTPLKTFHVLMLSVFHCVCFLLIVFYIDDNTHVESTDSECKNDGYEFKCEPKTKDFVISMNQSQRMMEMAEVSQRNKRCA